MATQSCAWISLCRSGWVLPPGSVSACCLWSAQALCDRPSQSSFCHSPCMQASHGYCCLLGGKAWELFCCCNWLLKGRQVDTACHCRERAAGYYSSYPFSLAIRRSEEAAHLSCSQSQETMCWSIVIQLSSQGSPDYSCKSPGQRCSLLSPQQKNNNSCHLALSQKSKRLWRADKLPWMHIYQNRKGKRPPGSACVKLEWSGISDKTSKQAMHRSHTRSCLQPSWDCWTILKKGKRTHVFCPSLQKIVPNTKPTPMVKAKRVEFCRSVRNYETCADNFR